MRDSTSTRGTPLLLLGLALVATVACERFDDTPRRVAASFWAAIDAHDLAAARNLSDAENENALRELADGLALEGVMLDEILRNESTALVETRAGLARRDMDLAFNTHLTRDGDSWRVAVDATESELRRAALAASFEDVRESIGESTDLLVEEFEKQALDASEALREALEGLEESLRQEPPPST